MMSKQENPRKPEQGFSQEKSPSKTELKQRKQATKAGKTTSKTTQRVDEKEKEKNPTWGCLELSLNCRLLGDFQETLLHYSL